MLPKTDNFFVISNYNTDPELYLDYCRDFIIYDQTPDPNLAITLQEKYGSRLQRMKNTGHNISDYFTFFYERYENLPSTIMLLKGNIIGRHVSRQFFERAYNKKIYTFLYEDRSYRDQTGIAYQLYDGGYLEINNSWYMTTKHHEYFDSYNDLLTFIFKEPLHPQWILFSPGACYIVTAPQVKQYPKIFYKNLQKIISYTYFPAEAYILERMLHIIFSGIYDIHDHCLDETLFEKTLEEHKLKKITQNSPPIHNASFAHRALAKLRNAYARIHQLGSVRSNKKPPKGKK